MALPATAAFTGSNGTDIRTLTDWDGGAAGGTSAGLEIQSNAAAAQSTNTTHANWWTTDAFASAHYSQATIISLASGVYIGVAVRVAGTDNSNNVSGYFFYSDSADGCYIDGYNAGTFIGGASLAGPGAVFATSDLVRLEIDASGNLLGKVNGVTRLSVTNTDLAGGAAGICAYSGSTSARIDNWEGGNVAAAGKGFLTRPNRPLRVWIRRR